MSSDPTSFGQFSLDFAARKLTCGDDVVDLPSRYLDVLILLVEAGGALVTKDRFMDAVWRGVPVTDEALTQAIRTLRKALGDSATDPRYIETVPKHGYRFIASVSSRKAVPVQLGDSARSVIARQILAGATGALLAGGVVGMLYGFVGAAQASHRGVGTVSMMLVLILVSALSAGVAGVGIAAGIAWSRLIHPPRWYWTVVGGAVGGATLGALANMIGKDAFRLLLGQVVEPFTGAMEGFVVGAASGFAFGWSQRQPKQVIVQSVLLGAGSGVVVVLLGGHLMAGSLQSLIAAFPFSELRLDSLGRAFGEDGLGPIGRAWTAVFEAALFTLGLVAAMRSLLLGSMGGVDGSLSEAAPGVAAEKMKN